MQFERAGIEADHEFIARGRGVHAETGAGTDAKLAAALQLEYGRALAGTDLRTAQHTGSTGRQHHRAPDGSVTGKEFPNRSLGLERRRK